MSSKGFLLILIFITFVVASVFGYFIYQKITNREILPENSQQMLRQ